MSKLRDKFLEIEDSQSRYGGNLMFENESEQCEQITDDFAVKFLKWYRSIMFLLNHELVNKTEEELLQIFKDNIYE